ncbi:SDR family NAD(P)-dependent oxidoreductase [Gordonia sp. PP30]|uniref:SDR family NAD(P)-dependent oxidoreductase n=2 Tax=unclassified Gordonia (in: high G+C Gram-positive bacteria) TaxID=2657482 RepID=UPI002000199A|nr:SDR family NAD(P)-dependent oxidoreductase [Gordonia sp. PP30]UQE74663.1 SDR family NAD(P)-dependent oxidoreductase [Gordonia sp. PP30]
MTEHDLSHLHVAVTGGAQGIGAATARRLAARGAAVSIGDVDVPATTAQAAAIAAAHGRGRCFAAELDVRAEPDFRRFLAAAGDFHGTAIDVMVNNAGIMLVGPFREEAVALTDKQLAVNVGGVVNGTRVALEVFEDRGSGHVVNIASVAGRNAFANIATYTGTKHFVYGFTEALRSEYSGTGIEFTTVLPNIAKTRLGSGVSGVKMVRKSDPEDIAEAIVAAIASPAPATYIPRTLAPLSGLAQAVPSAVRDRVFGLLGADRALVDTDDAERAAYDEVLGR